MVVLGTEVDRGREGHLDLPAPVEVIDDVLKRLMMDPLLGKAIA